MKTKVECSIKPLYEMLPMKDVPDGSYFIWCGGLYRKMYGTGLASINYAWIANVEDESVVLNLTQKSKVKLVKKLSIQLEV